MSGYVFPIVGDYRISSGFGGRASPGGIGSTNHGGIDLAAARGTPVVAPISGTIEAAGSMRGYGNAIYLRGDDGRQYRFAHLDGFDVRSGRVTAGQQIGRVGSTGNSTGNHLHFEIRDSRGRKLNPANFLQQAQKAATGGLLDEGKKLLDKGLNALGINVDSGEAAKMAANAVIPGSGEVLEGLGIVGECDWFCQLKEWISGSGFFTRIALGILALIIIAAAVAYFARGELQGTVSQVLKGKLK